MLDFPIEYYCLIIHFHIGHRALFFSEWPVADRPQAIRWQEFSNHIKHCHGAFNTFEHGISNGDVQ